MANTYPGNYAKRNYLCHFARVILYFQGTYGFCNPANSLFPIPTVTICMLWFIRLLENTTIYQLWASTDCSGAVQAASLATSKGVGGGKGGKEREMATGGKWECEEWWSVLPATACVSAERQWPCFPQPSWICAHRPCLSLLHPHFCSSHCFSRNLYLCFIRQQICLKRLCSEYAVLEGLDLCKGPWGIWREGSRDLPGPVVMGQKGLHGSANERQIGKTTIN